MTLIVAGHETTASSLNWFWYLLTQSPEVETRIHAEVDRRTERPTRPTTLSRAIPARGERSTRRCACIRPAGS